MSTNKESQQKKAPVIQIDQEVCEFSFQVQGLGATH